MGEPVGSADDEGVEGVLGVESGALVIIDTGGRLGGGFSRSDGDLGNELGRWDGSLFLLVVMFGGTEGQLQIGVDGDGEMDALVELVREEFLELMPHLGLDAFTGELVGDGDHDGRAVHRHRCGVGQPRPVGFGDLLEDFVPGRVECFGGITVSRLRTHRWGQHGVRMDRRGTGVVGVAERGVGHSTTCSLEVVESCPHSFPQPVCQGTRGAPHCRTLVSHGSIRNRFEWLVKRVRGLHDCGFMGVVR